MLYFFIKSLEKALLPSRMAAFFRGPNTRSPASSSTSTSPAARGSSGPTMTRSTSFSLAKEAILSNSSTPMGTHSATSAIPAFPGAQYILSAFGLSATATAIACSRPPPPTIRIFICISPFRLLRLLSRWQSNQ